jgi:CO/xanthine dehydrogenase FAD-binding subunit
MYAAAFDYVRASSWSDAVSALAQAGEDARVIAGGQSLVPMMLLGLAQPATLVDVGSIEKPRIERRDGALVLSALTRHVDLESSAEIETACPMLAEAARLIGNIRVRHRGTIGGSLAHAEPTAELPCVAIAHGATVRALGPDGERAIPAAELFVTHFTTSLRAGEVITSIEFPALGGGQGSCFLELARRPGDFAMVNVAAVVSLADGGQVRDARVVVGATGDRPAEHSDCARALHGEPFEDGAASEVGKAVAREVEVGPSTHAGADYRREMVAVLVKRALRTAVVAAAARAHAGEGGRS